MPLLSQVPGLPTVSCTGYSFSPPNHSTPFLLLGCPLLLSLSEMGQLNQQRFLLPLDLLDSVFGVLLLHPGFGFSFFDVAMSLSLGQFKCGLFYLLTTLPTLLPTLSPTSLSPKEPDLADRSSWEVTGAIEEGKRRSSMWERTKKTNFAGFGLKQICSTANLSKTKLEDKCPKVNILPGLIYK